MGKNLIAETDIGALERSVVEAVAPARTVEIGGWLVPLDGGAMPRAQAAVPLRHDLGPDALDAIEAAYAAANLPTIVRLADRPGLAAVRADLIRRGYRARRPAVMKLGGSPGLLAMSDAPAELFDRPDAAWLAAFEIEDEDPRDSASRARSLAAAPDSLYAAVRDGERTIAVGVVSFGQGWAGIHGMRTAADRRREGLASRVLAGLGAAVAQRGFERVSLQAEEPNPARLLYRQAGFELAWRYDYWSRDPG